MPTKKLFLTIAAASAMVFFAGCQTGTQISTSTNQQSSGTQATIVYSAADAAALQGALELKDPAMCDKISDTNAKSNCKNALNNQKTLADALAKTDASLCKKMSSADQQKGCEINVETQIKLQEQAKQQQQAIADLGAKQNKIVQSGDYTQCKTLEDPNLVITCESNILTNKGLESGDAGYCEKISDQVAKNRCQQTIKKSVAPTQP